jgi:hypothetical protein
VGRVLLRVICVAVFLGALVLTNYYLSRAWAGSPLNFALPNVEELKQDFSWQRMASIAGVMLAGIVFGYFYQRFTELSRRGVQSVRIGREVKKMLSATSFYLALFASPIVFGIVIAASKGAPLFAALFLAFQNGFFWQTVMPKSAAPDGAGAPGAAERPPAQETR